MVKKKEGKEKTTYNPTNLLETNWLYHTFNLLAVPTNLHYEILGAPITSLVFLLQLNLVRTFCLAIRDYRFFKFLICSILFRFVSFLMATEIDKSATAR